MKRHKRHTGMASLLVILTVLRMGILMAETAETSLPALYEQRMIEAAEQLAQTRESIKTEKAPLAKIIRETEQKIIDLNANIHQFEMEKAQFENHREALKQNIEAHRKSLNYMNLLAEEGLEGMQSSLQPGESWQLGQSLDNLLAQLKTSEIQDRNQQTREAFSLIAKRISNQIGGYKLEGPALSGADNTLRDGEFIYFGPTSYFRDAATGQGGIVRLRKGSDVPFSYPLASWSKTDIANLFNGQTSIIPVDITGGKAIQLEEVDGTIWDHIQKGGVVGYIIIALGVFAFLTGLLKLWDIRSLAVDRPALINRELAAIQDQGSLPDKDSDFRKLKHCVRELFKIGLNHANKPKDFLEEMMYGQVLLWRNHHERRLPLLRVVAATAPLLGLLGTVVGMIKTFTLITIFGTGNAAKLSSGISEALITTELGLIVAIPTLIIYGYLAHQTERRLTLLEQYSAEFVNLVQGIQITRERSGNFNKE